MRDRCGRRVAGGAGPNVLQCEAGRQISAGKRPVLLGRCYLPAGKTFFLPAVEVLSSSDPLLLSPDVKAGTQPTSLSGILHSSSWFVGWVVFTF